MIKNKLDLVANAVFLLSALCILVSTVAEASLYERQALASEAHLHALSRPTPASPSPCDEDASCA